MRAYAHATQTPWLIESTHLRQLLLIAARLEGDTDLAAELRAARAATPAAVALRQGRPLDGANMTTVRDGVALIPVTGPIFRYADFFTAISGATALESLTSDFGAALADPGVTAILFWLDSPGGEATGIADFGEQIYAARGAKPIEAYVECACSAAYWIASATSRITAEPNALLGSVGTVMAVADPSHPSRTPPRDIEIVSSQSPNKRPDVQTEAGRGRYQQIVDQMTETFISTVARNRSLTEEQVIADFEQGGVLVGPYAVAAGMADRLGTFEQTVGELSQQAQDRRVSRMTHRMALSAPDRLSARLRGNLQ